MAKQSPNLDSVTTINRDGSRNFLHPADVHGKFTFWRRLVAIALIVFFTVLPWIKIGGKPFMFLDVVHRRFHVFGYTLATQDLWLLFFLITGLAFGLFFATALFGRLWCGWACPQTIYMEHVYRRIERWIEGDSVKQRKLDNLSWNNPKKLLKRGIKLILFWTVSWLISHIFLAYFVSIPQLYLWMTTSPFEHWHAFVSVFVATLLLFLNFTWFREQLCIMICPYGRLQSALTDDDSVIIAYDEKRGEPRGHVKNDDVGDCIDCNRCVQVCPTGIDIRQGLQMECIGCANCIDACNDIMMKVKRPEGLIRYSSLTALNGGKTSIFRLRIVLYAFLALLGLTVLTVSLSKIKPAYINVVRMRGIPFYMEETTIRNQFQVRVINKMDEHNDYHLEFDSGDHFLTTSDMSAGISLGGWTEELFTLILFTPIDGYTGSFPVHMRLYDGDEFLLEKKVEFIGPNPKLLKDGS